ncbi:DUF2861 family protein [Vibrio sp. F74]|uniref:DUF2861 family protein n=1 Tax=Vibrio sp. F74 TaxID=700020 RepID=UPI0036F19FA2
MNIRPLFFIIAIAFPSVSQAAWFTDTPLQRTYQALIDQQPILAWQELKIALNQNQLDSQFWVPVKQEVLSQTECGQDLSNDFNSISNIQVSFIRRFGLSSQGYQLKISSRRNTSDQDIALVSPSGKRLLSGKLIAHAQYQEIETEEMLLKPPSGVYQLEIGQNSYPIIASMDNNKRWLKLEHKLHSPSILITPPRNVIGCPEVNASWQWFDEQYNMLGNRVPIQNSNLSVPKESPYSYKAKHLSAAVELTEYQNGTKINYIQRVAIPFSPENEAKQ